MSLLLKIKFLFYRVIIWTVSFISKLANMIDVSQTEWDWGGEASQVMKSSLIPIQTSI